MSSIFAAKHNLQGGGRVIPLVGLETPAALPERLPSGLAEFDRAIGGGIVAGSAMLVGGDPGIGKSTLLLQVAARLASEGNKRHLCLGRGIGRAGAAARGSARPRRGAGAARGGDLGARHPDHRRRWRPPALLIIDSIQTMHSRPDRGRARHGQPGPRLGAGAGALRQGAWHRGRAGRPRHQGRHDRRPARARAYGRHGAELRGRAQPPVPHPPRDEEPLRRHRRDRRVRDGRRGADRSSQPVGPVPDPPRRAGQRHQRVPGDRGLAAGAGRDPGADGAARNAARRRAARRSAGTAGAWR